jgi:hypothetical protein
MLYSIWWWFQNATMFYLKEISGAQHFKDRWLMRICDLPFFRLLNLKPTKTENAIRHIRLNADVSNVFLSYIFFRSKTCVGFFYTLFFNSKHGISLYLFRFKTKLRTLSFQCQFVIPAKIIFYLPAISARYTKLIK